MGEIRRRLMMGGSGKPSPLQSVPIITQTSGNISVTPVQNVDNGRYITRMNNSYHGTSEGVLTGPYTQRSVSSTLPYVFRAPDSLIEITTPSNAIPQIRWYIPNSTGSGTTIGNYGSQGSARRSNVVIGLWEAACIGSTIVVPCTWSETPYVWCFPKVSASTDMIEHQAVTNTGSSSYYNIGIGNAVYDYANNRVIGFAYTARHTGSGSGGIDIWSVNSSGTFSKTHITSWVGTGDVNKAICDFLCVINGTYYLYIKYPNVQVSPQIAPYWVKSNSITATSWSAVTNGETLPFDAQTVTVKWHQFSDGLIAAYQVGSSMGTGYSTCRIYSTWDLIHWTTLEYNVGDYKYSNNIYNNSGNTNAVAPNWAENSQYYYYLGKNAAGAAPTASAIIAWPKA